MTENELSEPVPVTSAPLEPSASRMHLLQNVNAGLANCQTIEDAVQSTINTLYTFLPQQQISFWILTPQKDLKLESFAGSTPPDITSIPLDDGEYALTQAARENLSFCLDEPSAEPGLLLLNPNSHSLLCIPVTFQDRLLGLINLENAQPNAYDESDLQVFTILVANLASVLVRIKSLEELNLHAENQKMLYEITNKIHEAADIETILKTTIAEVAKALKVKHASIEITGGEFDSKIQSSPSSLPANQEGA